MKKSVVIILTVSVLTAAICIAALSSAQASTPKLIPTTDHMESSEYIEYQKNLNKQTENKTTISSEEQKVINTKQDELIDLYHKALEESIAQYSDKINDEEYGWIYRGKAESYADEQLIKTLIEETLTILKNYGAINSNISIEDFCNEGEKYINIACDAINNLPLTTEEQVTIKFLINQTYETINLNNDTSFIESVEKKVNLENITYIESWTPHSYEKQETMQIAENESSI